MYKLWKLACRRLDYLRSEDANDKETGKKMD